MAGLGTVICREPSPCWAQPNPVITTSTRERRSIAQWVRMYAHLQVTANYCNVAGTEAKGENCILAVGFSKAKLFLMQAGYVRTNAKAANARAKCHWDNCKDSTGRPDRDALAWFRPQIDCKDHRQVEIAPGRCEAPGSPSADLRGCLTAAIMMSYNQEFLQSD